MANETILILGATGMLGSVCYRYLKNANIGTVIGTSRKKHDSTAKIRFIEFNIKHDTLEKECLNLINFVKPTIIINCLGVIPQNNPKKEDYILINYKLPQMLAYYTKTKDYWLIQPSTDCVFSGDKPGEKRYNLYTKNDPTILDLYPESKNWYSIYKTIADRDIQADSLVLRGSIIGPNLLKRGNGFFDWILKSERKYIEGYTNHFWNGNTTLEFAKIIENLILAKNKIKGLIHIGNEQIVSKKELAQLVSRKFGLGVFVFDKQVNYLDRTISSQNEIKVKPLNEQLTELKDWINKEKIWL